MLEVFKSRKMATLLLLGFSSGLPLYLTSRTLQAWMTVEGVNLTAIGLFSLVGLPYSVKFLWSPLVDRFSLPFLGRRKSWISLMQLALVISIGAMAFQRPATALQFVALNTLAIAFFSATQDITVDAYRADVLDREEMAAGAGVFVLGYRIGMIVTGSAALIIADRMSWPAVYLLLAAAMLATMIVSTRAPEPRRDLQPPSSLSEAVRMPFIEFFKRSGMSRGLTILAFIVLFQLGDQMINNMTTPFLLQIGFSQTDVGAIQGGVGLLATIAGALAAGTVSSRTSLYRALWIVGVLQAASNFGYMALANAGHNYPMMIAAIVIENFCTGLGGTTLVAFLMSLCNPRFSATQYALLSSVIAVTRAVLVSPAGALASATGWPVFFLISVFAAMPGLVALRLLKF